jgi:alanyl-tRNA synthetase
VVALFSADGGKVSFVVATTEAARSKGLAAGTLIPAFAPAVGGRGGGKPDLAQGGGVPADQAPALLNTVERALVKRATVERAG